MVLRGILNLVIGGIFVVGGLSGELVLKGTQSGGAIALIGLGLCGLGIYRLVQARSAPRPELPRE